MRPTASRRRLRLLNSWQRVTQTPPANGWMRALWRRTPRHKFRLPWARPTMWPEIRGGMMTSIVRLVSIAGGAVLGLALGFSLRGVLAKGHVHQGAAVASVTNAASSAALTNSVHRVHTQIDNSPLATQLARDLSMSSGVTNWLCWWQALAQA